MRGMTSVLSGVLVLSTALVASPQSPRKEAPQEPLSGCGYLVQATVLDLVDEPGTETASPTYRVIVVSESGAISTQRGTAYDRARAIAAGGIRQGDVFYPASTIRRVTVSSYCP